MHLKELEKYSLLRHHQQHCHHPYHDFWYHHHSYCQRSFKFGSIMRPSGKKAKSEAASTDCKYKTDYYPLHFKTILTILVLITAVS